MDSETKKKPSDKRGENEYSSNEEKAVSECEEKPCVIIAALNEKDQENTTTNVFEKKANISDERERTSPCTATEKNKNLDLTMSAKEMREMIANKEKKDPRKEKRGDMRRRVEMVEAL
eukprot:GFUD01060231.1.p2 GENE.GFUD01060231.1~~GFUD01060231.1.p2  ORF type:complete len:118 (+),score=54.65 GFUD01060231.1:81-434(+)